ncbi:MAG TPA: hypothetical protein VNF06_02840 [Candidatus Aquilonibacter sp.]|nr:hypothetical protein [Candidatus Aquilonibacter sp.]
MAQQGSFKQEKSFSIEESISLLRNSSFEVKIKLAESENTNIQILKYLCDEPDSRIRYAVAYNKTATPALFEKLSKDQDWTVRYAVARNPTTTSEIIDALSSTSFEFEERVRSAAIQNPNISLDRWEAAYSSYDRGESSAARLNARYGLPKTQRV